MAPDALEQACTTQAMALGALEQAYTTQAGVGLIAIELKSGKIEHQSPSFEDLTSWLPVEARGNIRISLESRDGDDFHSFCQSVVGDAGELCGETFLDRDKVVGRSITVRFFTRAPGPPGLRNPEWLLMVRAVKLTLVGVQPRQLSGGLPVAGRRLPFRGQARIPEAVGVFTVDLSGNMPSQWTVQAAHIRNLLDMDVALGTYEIEVGDINPLEILATLFNLGFSGGQGAGVSVFSRAAAKMEYAAKSALNLAQRSVSWFTRQALGITITWSMHLNDDDTVLVRHLGLFTFLGGWSCTILHDFVGGNVAFSQGGLDFLFFVADPEQPLDNNLRATRVRVAEAKTRGAFDVHHPFVMSCMWGSGIFRLSCKAIPIQMVGKVKESEENVSQLFEKLKVSPGGGHISDGFATICVGQSDAEPS